MSKLVLWIDNEPYFLEHYVDLLKSEGYEVINEKTVTAGEFSLKKNKQTLSLVILDVMIPTQDASEENNYPPSMTEFGASTGLAFYKKVKDILDQNDIPVLVFTQRLDLDIKEAFMKAGIIESHFATKLSLRQTEDFLDKVESLT